MDSKTYLAKCRVCGTLGSPRSLEGVIALIEEHRESFPNHKNKVRYVDYMHPSMTRIEQRIGTPLNF